MVKTKKVAESKPEETKSTVAKTNQSEPEVSGCISLGTVSNVTVGRNKGGQPWKKGSKRSEFSRGPPISYLKSMEEKARLKRI